MSSNHLDSGHDYAHDRATEVPFASNDVRLSLRGCVIAALVIGVAYWLIPVTWEYIEPLRLRPDYRIPYRLGNDYWDFSRTCREECRGEATLLVGDSVIWGHYVESHQTLSHYLGTQLPGCQFDNLGIDGIHSVALAGLVRYYGQAIHDKRVIVNCDMLWMSSPRHDLTADKEIQFNHQALVPQFYPWITCYKATISQRLGITIARQLTILQWADHLRIAYFNSDNLSRWTIDHPYQNPLQQITLELPSPEEPPSPTPDAHPWYEKGIRPVTPEWVDLDDSLQWQFFRNTVRHLQQRGNQVFVLIGPLNEHMLTPNGLAGYNERKQQIVAWHQQQGIPYFAPPALPSREYADLSHPTSEGYAQLAKEMAQQTNFRNFLQP